MSNTASQVIVPSCTVCLHDEADDDEDGNMEIYTGLACVVCTVSRNLGAKGLSPEAFADALTGLA